MSIENKEIPSYFSSTLSQLAVACVAAYLLGALWISFTSKDIASLKWAAEIFGAGYLASRKPNGNGGTKPNAAPTP